MQVDQEALGQIDREVNERRCPFEKVLLNGQASCPQAQRSCIGERIMVGCASDSAQVRCHRFLDLVRRQSRFTLKTVAHETALTHAHSLRIQLGGLRGARLALDGEAAPTAPIADIDGLLTRVAERFGELARLPWQPIVQQVASSQDHQRRRRGRKGRDDH